MNKTWKNNMLYLKMSKSGIWNKEAWLWDGNKWIRKPYFNFTASQAAKALSGLMAKTHEFSVSANVVAKGLRELSLGYTNKSLTEDYNNERN